MRMLHVDPLQRINLQQVLNHSWIANRDALPKNKLTIQDPHLVKVGAFSALYVGCCSYTLLEHLIV